MPESTRTHAVSPHLLAVLYSGACYAGERLVCVGDVEALPEAACASIRVRPGTTAILYEKSSLAGRRHVVTTDLPDLFLAAGGGTAWGSSSGPGSIQLLASASRVHHGRWALRAGGKYLAATKRGLEAVEGLGSAGMFRLVEEANADGTRLLSIEGGDDARSGGALLTGYLEGDARGPFTLRDPGSGRMFCLVDGVLAPKGNANEAAVLTAPLMLAISESEVGALSPGEAALFIHPNYRGAGLIVRGDLDQLTGIATQLGIEAAADHGLNPRSVLLGPSTGLTLSPGEAQEGQEREVRDSTPLLELTGFDRGVRSSHSWRNLDAADAGVHFTYALAQDFLETAGGLEETTVYRTNIRVPPGVAAVELWADSEVDVEIAGVSHTLDPEVPVLCKPNQIGQLTVTLEPTGLGAPTLWLRTPAMGREERIGICADRGLHERLASLEEGALYEAKDASGEFLVSREHSPEQAAAVQQAVTQAMRLVTSAGKETRGHTTEVRASGMEHRNWVLDLGDSPRVAGLDEASAIAMVGTGIASGDLAQSLIKNIGRAIGTSTAKVTRVIVQTARPLAKPVTAVVSGAGKAVGDVTKGVGDVAGGLVKGVGHVVEGAGDVVEDAGRVVIDASGQVIHQVGGVVNVIGNVGGNVVEGVVDAGGHVIGTVGDFLEDVGEFVVVTFKFAGESKAVQVLVKSAKEVAALAEKIYEQVGVVWTKVVGWLRETFSFLDIGRLHETIEKKYLAPLLESGAASVESFRPQLDRIFDALEAQLTNVLGDPASGGGTGLTLTTPTMPGILRRALDAVMEKIDWLINKVFAGLEKAFDWRLPQLPDISSFASVQRLGEIIGGSALGRTADEALGGLMAGIGRINPANPAAFFEIIRSTMSRLLSEGLALLRKAADVIIELVLELWEAIKRLVADPDTGRIEVPFISSFYRLATGASTLTISRLVAFVVALPVTVVDALTPLNVAAGRGLSQAILSDDDKDTGHGPDPQRAIYGVLTIFQAACLAVADNTIEPVRFSAGAEDEPRGERSGSQSSQASNASWESIGGAADERRDSLSSVTSHAEWEPPFQRRLARAGELFLIFVDASREWIGTGIKIQGGASAKALLENAVVGLAWTPIALDLISLHVKGHNKRFIEQKGPMVDAFFDTTSTLAVLGLSAVDHEARPWDVTEGIALTIGDLFRLPLTASPLSNQTRQVHAVVRADLAFGALGLTMLGEGLLGTGAA